MKAIIKALGLCLILFIVLPLNSFGTEIPESTGKAIKSSNGVLTLSQAVALALIQNPELAAFSWEIRAREANALQAGLLPNPNLDVEVENVGGSGDFRGAQQSETTILLSQLIELGGKRAKRTRLASFSKQLANWDYETKRMEVLTQVSKAYTDVLKSQEQLKLAKDLNDLAAKTLDTVSEKVKAGKVSPIEETKAKIEFSSTRIKLVQAKSELNTARKRLAATWESSDPRFDSVSGNLYSLAPIPSYQELTLRLSKNPDLARWATEMVHRQAAIDHEVSKAIPDITLSGGYRRLEETNDNAAVVGISIPLQFFNRNQGAIQAARHRLARIEAEKRAAQIRVNTTLAEAFNTLTNTYSRGSSLKNEILPQTKSAFDAVTEGYRFGKFSFLDVLDSQRTLFKARSQYLDALGDYHKAVADVERVTGEPVAKFLPTHIPPEKETAP